MLKMNLMKVFFYFLCKNNTYFKKKNNNIMKVCKVQHHYFSIKNIMKVVISLKIVFASFKTLTIIFIIMESFLILKLL